MPETANRASEMSGKPVRLGRKFDRQAGCLGPLHPLLCLVLSQELCTSFSLCLAPPLGLWMADSSFSSQRNIATSEKPPRVAGSHIRGSMSFVAELSPISGSPHLLLGPHVCCLSPQWLPHFYWALSKSCSLGAQYVAHMDFIHGCVRLGHVPPTRLVLWRGVSRATRLAGSRRLGRPVESGCVDTEAQSGCSLPARGPVIRVTSGSYPVETQGPLRRGGSSTVTGALLGAGCWQRGSQCRRPPPAVPVASVVRAAKQTERS